MAKSPKVSSKRLVIDASVAGAAGGDAASAQVSCDATQFLQAVLRICHHAAMTPQLAVEWLRHQSLFSMSWLAEMRLRNKVDMVDGEEGGLATRLASTKVSGSVPRAFREDAHLIDGALRTDRVVVSLDATARQQYSAVVELLPQLRRVMWVDPSNKPDAVMRWLEQGAEHDPASCLGS